jgi:hypothetical protein
MLERWIVARLPAVEGLVAEEAFYVVRAVCGGVEEEAGACKLDGDRCQWFLMTERESFGSESHVFRFQEFVRPC